MGSIEQWLGKMARLKVDRARGDPAPHKPLLVLVLLDLAEQGQLPEHELPLTPELAFRFCTFWSIVARRRKQKPDVRYPFHHLSSDGLWACLQADRQPSVDRRQTRYAVLAPDFVTFALDPAAREQARRILIARYFPQDERVALYTMLGMPIPSEDQVQADAAYHSPDEAKKRGREARFRLQVVAAYNYTCALTRYRLTTITAGSIVDAAHIHKFSDSRNNDPRNGLALCKNAHWLFDNGLWTLADDLKVLVARDRFAESSPDQKPLAGYEGHRIHLPLDNACWPDPVYLAWHRKHHQFQGD
jgi:putative restriction endonuclease